MDQSKQGGGKTREDKIDGTLLQEREVSYGFNSCSYLIWAEEQGLGPLQPEVVGLLGGGTQGPVTWPWHSGPRNIVLSIKQLRLPGWGHPGPRNLTLSFWALEHQGTSDCHRWALGSNAGTLSQKKKFKRWSVSLYLWKMFTASFGKCFSNPNFLTGVVKVVAITYNKYFSYR